MSRDSLENRIKCMINEGRGAAIWLRSLVPLLKDMTMEELHALVGAMEAQRECGQSAVESRMRKSGRLHR
jgi:hypothetical protein